MFKDKWVTFMKNKRVKKQRRIIITSYKRRLLICITIPVILTLSFYTALTSYFLNNIKKQLLEQCLQSHNSFCNNYELDFQELYQGSCMLVKSDTFKSVYFTSSALSPQENYMFKDVVSLFSTYAACKPYIIQVGFVNPVNKRYISSGGTVPYEYYWDNQDLDTVLNETGSLDGYVKRNGIFQFQPLETSYNQSVVPMLQYRIANYNLINPIIYCIGKSDFSSLLENYKLTQNSKLLLYNVPTKQFIASNDSGMEEKTAEIINKEWQSGKEKYSLAIDGVSYYGYITESDTTYTDPLLFVTLIPQSDIKAQTSFFWELIILALAICCMIAVILSFYMSFHLYSPIKNLLHMLQADEEETEDNKEKNEGDELFYIDNHIRSLLTNNNRLQDSMRYALPMLYTRYILNIIYEKEYENEKLEPILKNYDFHFPYDYFSCSILTLQLSDLFYDNFTELEQNLIISKLHEVLELTQDEYCVKYVFTIDKTRFCIISNAPYQDHRLMVQKDFSSLQELFSFDKDYVSLYMGCGETCFTIQNLPQSWKQANMALSQLSSYASREFCFYQEPEEKQESYSMKTEEDNHLSMYLLQGKIEQATVLMQKIIERNQDSILDEDVLKDLYIHFYEIGNTVLRQCRGSGFLLMGDDYIELSSYIHNLTNLERSDYLYRFFSRLCQKQQEEAATSFDLEKIKEYVDNHYAEDIYLESLAETFHTSAKYISRVLKQALGDAI